MGLSCGEQVHGFDKRESEGSSFEMDRQDQFHNDVEFWPVEHPMEPQDEDRPVKCPIPTSSLINDGRVGEEQSLKKRAVKKESIVMVETFEPSSRSVRKRLHSLTHGDRVGMPLATTIPNSPSPNVTVFEMLQRLDEFGS